jgi:iron complex outermembrane recepter protein
VLPERFEVGAGVYLVGERPGDFSNSFELPGYGVVDAFAAYHWKLGTSRLTAQLNVKNLLDKEYFLTSEPAFSGAGQFPGEPLTVIGALRIEY